MRALVSLMAIAAGAAAAAGPPYFSVLSSSAGSWPDVLGSIGLEQRPAAMAGILVARAGAAASPEWNARVEKGAILILEGESSLAEMFGFRRGKGNVRVASVTDVHAPKLQIVWEKAEELPQFDMPSGVEVFARERRSGAPLLAGMRKGAGAILWVAVSPGQRGFERFPYLLNALCDLGLETPFRSSRLWAFFDSSYRLRVDLDYFAAKWRKSGISALHVAAWHYYDPDPAGDEYLKKLIEACHREGILVYAWLELPHVSEKFWADHPEWREKTALLQDAQLDWRKLMNLTNRECFRSVTEGVQRLIGRFDWDGVNLAELYFESLEGIGNPSRFTPMNEDVRALFRTRAGFDPIELFRTRGDEGSRRAFLDFRSELARNMQEEWLGELEKVRGSKPHLDLVLTHVDDRMDTGMRDAIGADAARVLPLLDRQSFTFLVEDPATIWNQGPQRYQTLAERYAALTPHREKLAIDLNVVERYQDVYPTKQQTGVELFELVHCAAAGFERVALYFESSLQAPDERLLPAAAASVTRYESGDNTVVIDSTTGVGIPWRGSALVDGHIWPVTDGETMWLPAGRHKVEAAARDPELRLVRLNADLESARESGLGSIEVMYRSDARAFAVLDRAPRRVRIDGAAADLQMAGPATVMLPSGRHVAIIESR